MEKDKHIFFAEEKEKEENIWRRENIFFEGVKEKEENIWRRKMYFCGGKEK